MWRRYDAHNGLVMAVSNALQSLSTPCPICAVMLLVIYLHGIEWYGLMFVDVLGVDYLKARTIIRETPYCNMASRCRIAQS
jgi:hypothetical protein